MASGWLFSILALLLASKFLVSYPSYRWLSIPISFIGIGFIGALFGFKWPHMGWRWGIWISIIPWLLELFSFIRHFQELTALHLGSFTVDLLFMPIAAFLGSYLGASLSVAKSEVNDDS